MLHPLLFCKYQESIHQDGGNVLILQLGAIKTPEDVLTGKQVR